MSQWAYRASSFVGSGNAAGDALAVTKPVGAASGDLMIIGCIWEQDGVTISPPAGWTSCGLLQNNTGLGVIELFHRIAGGSEPANYTFTPSVNGVWRSAFAAAYTGGTLETVDAIAGSQADADPDPYVLTGITTTGADRLVIAMWMPFGIGPSGVTVSGAVSTVRGNFGGGVLADAAQAAAGATGTADFSGSFGSVDWCGLVTAIASDAPASGNRRRRALIAA